MADYIELRELTKSIVPTLVSYKTWGDASFINMPLAYPSGAFVTVRLTHAPIGVRVSDSGFAYREAESFGAGRSFSKTAQSIAEEYELETDRRSIFVDVPAQEVERAILDVSAASHAIAAKIFSRITVDAEATISEELHHRLDKLFAKTQYDEKVVGASSTEWEVSAIADHNGDPAIFQIVTNYPVSVFRTSTAFHDIAALEKPPRLVSVVKSKKDMGKNYSILAQAGRVVEIGQSDDVFERAAA